MAASCNTLLRALLAACLAAALLVSRQHWATQDPAIPPTGPAGSPGLNAAQHALQKAFAGGWRWGWPLRAPAPMVQAASTPAATPSSLPIHTRALTIASGFMHAKALEAAVLLDVAAHLDRALPATTLAARLGAKPGALERVLRALAAAGIFEQVGPGKPRSCATAGWSHPACTTSLAHTRLPPSSPSRAAASTRLQACL